MWKTRTTEPLTENMMIKLAGREGRIIDVITTDKQTRYLVKWNYVEYTETIRLDLLPAIEILIKKHTISPEAAEELRAWFDDHDQNHGYGYCINKEFLKDKINSMIKQT